MPKKLRWTKENEADVFLRRLIKGEELVDGEHLSGNDNPSEVCHQFIKFPQSIASVFRAHCSKIKESAEI